MPWHPLPRKRTTAARPAASRSGRSYLPGLGVQAEWSATVWKQLTQVAADRAAADLTLPRRDGTARPVPMTTAWLLRQDQGPARCEAALVLAPLGGLLWSCAVWGYPASLSGSAARLQNAVDGGTGVTRSLGDRGDGAPHGRTCRAVLTELTELYSTRAAALRQRADARE